MNSSVMRALVISFILFFGFSTLACVASSPATGHCHDRSLFDTHFAHLSALTSATLTSLILFLSIALVLVASFAPALVRTPRTTSPQTAVLGPPRLLRYLRFSLRSPPPQY